MDLAINTIEADVAVIGAGTAGLTACKAAQAPGKRVVLIEAGPYGTTCARVGCMPSKLLIAAAEVAHAMPGAGAFGIRVGAVHIDGKAVMARVRTERDRFVNFVLEEVDQIPAADRLRGCARFVGPQALLVDDHTLVKAGRIVIATGSSPILPPELAAAQERLITSDDVFEWQDLPASVAVVGAGIIGLELGQALHRLGVRVTIFNRNDKIAQLSDPAIAASAARYLGAELDLRLHCTILSVQRQGDAVMLESRAADGTVRTENFAYVLAATGRLPNVHQLGLEHAGIALDTRGIPLFDHRTMQCGDSPIFIAGDVSNERPLLHEAADQGHIAGKNAGRDAEAAAGLRRTPLAIVFCDPQIATVGDSHATLNRDFAGRFVTGEVSFENQGRSRIMLQNKGLLRLYARQGSGRLLGAEMIGPRAEHLAHLLAWACQSRMTVGQMLDLPFYHPVVEEGLRTALRDAQKQIRLGSEPDEALLP